MNFLNGFVVAGMVIVLLVAVFIVEENIKLRLEINRLRAENMRLKSERSLRAR